jgi:hypothetical protein
VSLCDLLLSNGSENYLLLTPLLALYHFTRSSTVDSEFINNCRLKVKVTLQLTVFGPVSLGGKPLLGPWNRFLLLPDSCGFRLLFSFYIVDTDRVENTAFNSSSIVACVFVAVGKCLWSHCLATTISSGSTLLPFKRKVTISSSSSS